MTRRLFKLINGDVVFGETEAINEAEVLIKYPYTAEGGNIMPYMALVMGSAPGAIQLHVMNIVWSVPLDEFPEANSVYIKATTGIITDVKQKIII